MYVVTVTSDPESELPKFNQRHELPTFEDVRELVPQLYDKLGGNSSSMFKARLDRLTRHEYRTILRERYLDDCWHVFLLDSEREVEKVKKECETQTVDIGYLRLRSSRRVVRYIHIRLAYYA